MWHCTLLMFKKKKKKAMHMLVAVISVLKLTLLVLEVSWKNA